jgi:hypothetical protein
VAARRKQTSYRRGGKKKSAGIPAWFWLLGGILIGLGIAVTLMMKGYLPEIKQHLPTLDSASEEETESALVEDDDSKATKPKKPRYDFFPVLPEMEVVVPEQELSREADKPEPAPDIDSTDADDSYILQVGSFRSAPDAEQM